MPRTYLLDMDGTIMCRLNKDALNQTNVQLLAYADLPNLLIYHPFLSQICAEDTIMSGSYRTDLAIDLSGIMNFAYLNITGPSVIDVLKQISKDTNAKFDNFLFGDIGIIKQSKLHQTILHDELTPTGTTWSEMESFYDTYRQLDPQNLLWFDQACGPMVERALADYDKLIAMYVWLQRIALNNKVSTDHPHEVMFYDDHEKILQELINFYTIHSDWIPEGITLKIHRYAPGSTPSNHAENTIQPTLLKEIKGTGKHHPHFVQVARTICSSLLLLDISGSKRLNKIDFEKAKETLTQLGVNGTKNNVCTKKIIIHGGPTVTNPPAVDSSNTSITSYKYKINISGSNSPFIVTKKQKFN